MRIDISQHQDFHKLLTLGLQGSVERAVIATAQRIVNDITTELIPGEDHPPVDRGTYRAGWRVDAKKDVVYIVNNVLQSVFIERGVRATSVKPGRAMISALRGWVQRKGIGGNPEGPVSKLPKDEAESAAWAIAKSMSGYMSKIGWVPGTGIFKGTQTPSGLRILQRALEKFDRYFSEEVKRELKRLR